MAVLSDASAASSSSTVSSGGFSSFPASSFSGFERENDCELDIGAVLVELRRHIGPLCEAGVQSDEGLDVSPGTVVASVSPQVGDAGECCEAELSDAESFSSSTSGSFSLESSDSFDENLSLPSLPSAASGDPTVSEDDLNQDREGSTPVLPTGYLTRAARMRLFPEMELDDALELWKF